MKKDKIHIVCSDGYRMKMLVYHSDKPSEKATGVLWIHGGGYVTGMAAMAGTMGRAPALVRKFGAVVVSPEYRVGRKGRYPNALNDCYEALRYMVGHSEELGINRNQIFVGGESAGGGLASALCMLARDRKEIAIAYQMPLYPMLDDRDTASSQHNYNIVWNTPLNHFGWRTYLGPLYKADDVPPYAAPARQTDLSNLPPLYTFVSTGDPFYCETVAFVEALQAAGVDAQMDIYKGLFHSFDAHLPFIRTSRQAILRFESAFRKAQTSCFKAN